MTLPARLLSFVVLAFTTLAPATTHAQQPPAPAADAQAAAEQRFFAKVVIDTKEKGVTKGPTTGAPTGDEYTETAPDGGILIGFELWKGSFRGSMLVVGGIRPIFLTPKGRVLGKVQGRSAGTATVVEARPGYAVAGIDVKGGDRVDQMRVVFMKIGYMSARLESAGSYKSDWFGGKGGEKERHFYPNQKLILGIHGASGDQLDRLGLVHLERN